MKVIAGTLNQSVQLLAPVAGAAPNGDPAPTYAVAGTRRCSLVLLRPTATEAESQRQASSDVELLLRLDTLTRTLLATWRAVFQGTTYLIVGLDPTPHDASLLLYLRGYQS